MSERKVRHEAPKPLQITLASEREQKTIFWVITHRLISITHEEYRHPQTEEFIAQAKILREIASNLIANLGLEEKITVFDKINWGLTQLLSEEELEKIANDPYVGREWGSTGPDFVDIAKYLLDRKHEEQKTSLGGPDRT